MEPAVKNYLQRVFPLLVTALFLIISHAGTASAAGDVQEKAELWADVAENIDEAPDYEDPQDSEREWAISIGLSSGFAPDYEGSNDYSFGYGPNLSASWHDTIFYKGKTLGANLIRQKNLKAGPIISWASGRSEDANEKLEGLGDVDGSVEAGGFVSFRKKSMRFRAEARQDIDSGHEGALVDLSGGSILPFKNPLVFVGIGTTWASDDYMASFFGVDAKQSLNSGLEKYSADAGFKDIKISITAGYAITRRWRIGGAVEWKRLVGDAAGSPIVDEKNQFLAGFSLSYHMGSKILPEELQ
jgi:outer membrane scaffolding protein for murein synthesis (MipA/OmpV family)